MCTRCARIYKNSCLQLQPHSCCFQLKHLGLLNSVLVVIVVGERHFHLLIVYWLLLLLVKEAARLRMVGSQLQYCKNMGNTMTGAQLQYCKNMRKHDAGGAVAVLQKYEETCQHKCEHIGHDRALHTHGCAHAHTRTRMHARARAHTHTARMYTHR